MESNEYFYYYYLFLSPRFKCERSTIWSYEVSCFDYRYFFFGFCLFFSEDSHVNTHNVDDRSGKKCSHKQLNQIFSKKFNFDLLIISKHVFRSRAFTHSHPGYLCIYPLLSTTKTEHCLSRTFIYFVNQDESMFVSTKFKFIFKTLHMQYIFKIHLQSDTEHSLSRRFVNLFTWSTEMSYSHIYPLVCINDRKR